MYHYWGGANLDGLEFRPGDIVFIAGQDVSPPFEHVALVTEKQVVSSDEDFRKIIVIGLPESDPSRPCPEGYRSRLGGLYTRATFQTQYWEQRGSTGHPTRLWNLAGRILEAAEAEYFMDRLRHEAVSLEVLYDREFCLTPKGPATVAPLKTNCVGFVCFAFQAFDKPLVRLPYPEFAGQFAAELNGEVRFRVPRPGHVARALSPDVNPPYCPDSSAEAQLYCTAYQTLAMLS